MSSIVKSSQHPKQNNILNAISNEEYERILPDLELIEMPLGWTLSESGDHDMYVYFPISGIVSLIYELEDGLSCEIGIVGNEGLIGVSIYMGGESMPSSTEVQCAGFAYRLNRNSLKREFALGGHLQKLLLLYIQALFAQASQTAVCNRHHEIEQQLCRWFLMSLDRMHDNKVLITQDLLARLLGVRRESITEVAGRLQKNGLIALSRGRITVIDRPKLEKRVCECYKLVVEIYERLLPT